MKKVNSDIYSDFISQAEEVADSQSVIAAALDVTAGAVWQMLRSDREIYLIERPDGSIIDAIEIKHLGRFSKNPSKRARST